MAQLSRYVSSSSLCPSPRWKGSEQKALLKMAPEIRRDITPLLEIVPKQLEGGKRIERAARQIAHHWGWKELVFVDFHLLPNEVAETSNIRFSKAAAEYSIPFALSTGLRRSPTYQKSIIESIRATRCQLCLRLFKHDSAKRVSNHRSKRFSLRWVFGYQTCI